MVRMQTVSPYRQRCVGVRMRACKLALAAISGVVISVGAWGQDEQQESKAAPRGLWLAPTLSADSTLGHAFGSDTGPSNTALTQRVSPGLRLSHRSASWKSNLNYTANWVVRVDDRGDRDTEWLNSLSAATQGELVDGWAFFNGQITISQQPTFAQARLPGATGAISGNTTEVITLSLSPYVTGRLGALAEYQVRFSNVSTKSLDSGLPDSYSNTLSATVGSTAGIGRLGWQIYGAHQESDFSGLFRLSTTDRAGVELWATPTVDWRVALRAGQEYSDVGTPDRRAYRNVGATLQWTPSPRTKVILEADDRYFGRAHSVLLEHRSPLTSVRYVSSRDVVTGADAAGFGRTQSLYQLWMLQLTPIQPDPILRELLVFDLLRNQGRNPNDPVSGAFLVPGISLQQRQELSAAYNNRRLSIAFTAFRSHIARIDQTAQLVFGADQPTDQFGLNASASWRMTPRMNAAAGIGRQRTRANVLFPAADNNSINLSVNGQVGRRLFGTAGVRLAQYQFGSNRNFRELSLNGLLSLTF